MTRDIAPYLDQLGVDYDPDKGGNQKINCPFHEDSVASASVSLDEGLFNCFGCDIRGDVISIIMAHEGVTFGEAKRIAESVAGEDRRQVPRGADPGDSFLPRRQGSRPGRRKWVSPWVRRRP